MTLEDRIDNWRRAHRWFRARGHVFSLEGRYRSPRGAGWEQPPITFVPGVNLQDAVALEMAWGTLPTKPRWVLKLHYHDALPAAVACRRLRREIGLRVWPHEWDLHRISAILDLRDALQASERENRDAWRTRCKTIVDNLFAKVYGTPHVALAD